MTIETAITTAIALTLITLAWGAVKVIKRWPYVSTLVLCITYIVAAPVIFEVATSIPDDKDMGQAIGLSVFLLCVVAAVAGWATAFKCLDGER